MISAFGSANVINCNVSHNFLHGGKLFQTRRAIFELLPSLSGKQSLRVYRRLCWLLLQLMEVLMVLVVLMVMVKVEMVMLVLVLMVSVVRVAIRRRRRRLLVVVVRAWWAAKVGLLLANCWAAGASIGQRVLLLCGRSRLSGGQLSLLLLL